MSGTKLAAILISLSVAVLASRAHAFEAELKGRFGYSETGGVLVFAQTNLPDGLKFTVRVAGDGFSAKQIVVVEDGRFRAGPFQIEKSGLPAGTYHLIIGAGRAEGQPAKVREVIGDNWDAVSSEYITADLEGHRQFTRELDFIVD